jgi:hypothetical protein
MDVYKKHANMSAYRKTYFCSSCNLIDLFLNTFSAGKFVKELKSGDVGEL